MAISTIVTPDGTEHAIKDAAVRQILEDIVPNNASAENKLATAAEVTSTQINIAGSYKNYKDFLTKNGYNSAYLKPLTILTGQSSGTTGHVAAGNSIYFNIPSTGSHLIIAGQFGNSVIGKGDADLSGSAYLPLSIAVVGGQGDTNISPTNTTAGLGQVSYWVQTILPWSATDARKKCIRITQEWVDPTNNSTASAKGIIVHCTMMAQKTVNGDWAVSPNNWFIQAHCIPLGAVYGNYETVTE